AEGRRRKTTRRLAGKKKNDETKKKKKRRRHNHPQPPPTAPVRRTAPACRLQSLEIATPGATSGLACCDGGHIPRGAANRKIFLHPFLKVRDFAVCDTVAGHTHCNAIDNRSQPVANGSHDHLRVPRPEHV